MPGDAFAKAKLGTFRRGDDKREYYSKSRLTQISHTGGRNTQRIRHLRKTDSVDLGEMGREMR